MTAGVVVPVVDLSGWHGNDHDRKRAIAAEVDRAARTVGFMQILGHGVPDATRDGLTGAIDWFFGLPPETKARLRAPRPSINRGYTPPRAERLASSLGVVTPDDLFEAFNVGTAASEHPDRALDPGVYAENIWPGPELDGGPGFVAAVEAWLRAVQGVARTMTDVFAAALGLEPGYFAPFTDHSVDVLRINNYAVPVDLEVATGQMGMGAHSDYGIVTILWADPVPGLEIVGPDGTWSPVVPLPGALLINLGDVLARWTNDHWRSTMHRVAPPRDGDGRLIRRRSAALFHDGNADAVISTLAPCRDPGGGSNYPDVTVAQHLAEKLGGSRGLELNTNAEREAARAVAADDAAARAVAADDAPARAVAADDAAARAVAADVAAGSS